MSENNITPESEIQKYSKTRGPQNEGLKPSLEQKISDAVVDANLGKITRRAFFTTALAGLLALLRKREREQPNVTQSTKSFESFHLQTIDAPINPQISFQHLKREGFEFVADTENGELTVTDIPDVEVMELSDIKGEIIVRRGPSANNDPIELTVADLQKINPSNRYKVVRIIGGEYDPGFSHLGSTYVANSAENVPHGIWYAIVNEELQDGVKKYYFSDLYGNKISDSEMPFCLSANFGTVIKDQPQTSSVNS